MHGAAPVHIQLNLNDSVVCVLNQTAVDLQDITAWIRTYDIHGKLVAEEQKNIAMPPHSVQLLNRPAFPAKDTGVFFLRLELQKQGKTVDENFYWLSGKHGSYVALNSLEKSRLSLAIMPNGKDLSRITIKNEGGETAFFIRLKVVNEAGEFVLPVFLSENYFTLLPGESKSIDLDCTFAASKDIRKLKVVSEGWNVPVQEISL